MVTTMTKRETIGRAQFVSFTYADGRVGTQAMYPILDEFGGIVRWVSIAEGGRIAEAEGGKR